ncbi:hypothetical protein CB1_000164021 [Camelus ferus]|nr:hypothetical protein CB1_000164021 [Camelus ferus]
MAPRARVHGQLKNEDQCHRVPGLQQQRTAGVRLQTPARDATKFVNSNPGTAAFVQEARGWLDAEESETAAEPGELRSTFVTSSDSEDPPPRLDGSIWKASRNLQSSPERGLRLEGGQSSRQAFLPSAPWVVLVQEANFFGI